MVDTGIFATTLECQERAGANASSVANTEAYINSYIAQAESLINVMTLKNWSDIYSTLNADVKKILTVAASAYVANKIINFDMGGFTSREEAQTMLDVNKDDFLEAVSVLRDIVKRKFAVGA